MPKSTNNKIRIAALADLHVKESSRGAYQEIFSHISQAAEILVLCGDLTDLGLPSEATILAEELRSLRIPSVGVLGNHDFQSDSSEEVVKILRDVSMHVLMTEPIELHGIGFAGTKGFGGGFEKYSLGSFGESGTKQFVQETLNEVLMLENQLKELEQEDVQKKIVAMHYSPIRETLIGESLEIFPFLGSSRFVESIEAYSVSAVFHGHAHHGTPTGKTPRGVPVLNAAAPLMQKINPKQPFALIEI